ncbi:MAG: iron-sulfur cluster assembly accessory protein [Nitrospirota bacterium]
MTITDKAAEKAKAVLANEGKADWGIKIFVAGQSCCGPSYGLDLQEKKMPHDEVVEKNGLRIYMDKQTLDTLEGRELDYYVGEEGEGFIFTGGVSSCNPGASGCGTDNSGCSSCG